MKEDLHLDQEKRSALLDKISALLTKTEQSGCTEAEALAAAELAEKLMAKYGLSLTELEAISSPAVACEADGTPIGDQRCHEVVHLTNAIGVYTNTRSWYHTRGVIHVSKKERRLHQHRGVIAVFFGFPADVQVAIYLVNTLRIALDTEWRAYWRTYGKDSKTSARTARAHFMRGMTHRLSQRLREMKKAQGQANVNDCRTIVLAKERIVNEAIEAMGLKISHDHHRGPFYADPDAYAAGQAAGDRATIGSGALKPGDGIRITRKLGGQSVDQN
jgi:hypothetical protein